MSISSISSSDTIVSCSLGIVTRNQNRPNFQNPGKVSYGLSKRVKFQERGRTMDCVVCCSAALPETAASIVVAAVAVGTAATLLARTIKKTSESDNDSLITCEDCGGSGICSDCKGEGFVLKKLSEESADRARLAATNAATRYTAGLPKKWNYCFKCNASRSCITCRGKGVINS